MACLNLYPFGCCGPNRSLSGSTLTLTLGQGLDCVIVFVSWPFRSRVICLLPKGPLAEARWVRVRHSPHIEMKLRLQRFISKDLHAPGWSSHLAQPPAELKTLPSCSGQRKRFYGLMLPTQQSETWSGSWVHLPRVSCQGTCLLSREEWGLQYAYKGSSLSF